MVRVASVLALLAALLVAAPRAGAYGWPIKPFDAAHPVRGFFDDPRSDSDARHAFHSGIDISTPDGTPVYAIAAGTVDLRANSVAVIGAGDRTFGYWHVSAAVQQGQAVKEHELLGTTEPGWGHVHLSESYDGTYENPLRPGGIEPYVDMTSPAIDRIGTEWQGRTVGLGRVTGTVDLIASAYDTPTNRPAPPWYDSRVTPALVRWRLLRGSSVVQDWTTAADFRRDLLPATEFWDVFAPGTLENRANRPGRYRFYLARAWDTSTLPDGLYRVQVNTQDTFGNGATASAPLTIANGASPAGGTGSSARPRRRARSRA